VLHQWRAPSPSNSIVCIYPMSVEILINVRCVSKVSLLMICTFTLDAKIAILWRSRVHQKKLFIFIVSLMRFCCCLKTKGKFNNTHA
jgi:hypothetical protein